MSKINLPVERPARNLSTITVLPEVKTVESAMDYLARLELKLPGEAWSAKHEIDVYNDPLQFDLLGARKTLARIQRACALLPAVLRRAEPDEIATQLSLLQANDSHNDHRDERQQQLAMQIWCESIANRRPSIYALQLSFVHLREDYTFRPQLAEILSELEKAKKRAKRLQNLESRLSDLQQQLGEFEHDLPRLKKAHAAEQQRERARLQHQLADMMTSPSQYTHHDLQLLGITRKELLTRYRAHMDELKRRFRAKSTKGAKGKMAIMPKGWKVHGDNS
jgi:hypothetical protein